jgi:hypothetical protein
MLTLIQQAVEMPALLLARAPAIVHVACDAFTNFPPTSLLGVILWTGYFGDIVASHLKIF